LTCGTEAYEGVFSVVKPLTPAPASLIPVQGINYTTFDYLLGPNILFSPVVESGFQTATVTFPESSNWYLIFDPT